jgi:GDPmannose 4,6-dehydratase
LELNLKKTKIDKMLLSGEIEYTVKDKGIIVYTDKGKILIEFDQKRFRPAEVPILLSNTRKIQTLGFKVNHTLRDIIKDQLNYFLKKENRF